MYDINTLRCERRAKLKVNLSRSSDMTERLTEGTDDGLTDPKTQASLLNLPRLLSLSLPPPD